MDAPRTYLSLLAIAEVSPDAFCVVRKILDLAAAKAYSDVDKPFGILNMDEWLAALVKPRNWPKHPGWVSAIERRLGEFCADLRRDSMAESCLN